LVSNREKRRTKCASATLRQVIRVGYDLSHARKKQKKKRGAGGPSKENYNDSNSKSRTRASLGRKSGNLRGQTRKRKKNLCLPK